MRRRVSEPRIRGEKKSARFAPAGRLCRLSEAPAMRGRRGNVAFPSDYFAFASVVPARGRTCFGVSRAAGASAGGAAQSQEPHARAWGKSDSRKEKKASERRHNSFRSRGAEKKCGRDAQKTSPKMCLQGHFFFFVRIADKEMRQGSAGCSRGVSFPKIT